MVQMNRSARRIQKWFKAYLRHKIMKEQIKKMIHSTKVIQKAYRYWKFYIKDPKKRDEIMNEKSFFIQKFL